MLHKPSKAFFKDCIISSRPPRSVTPLTRSCNLLTSSAGTSPVRASLRISVEMAPALMASSKEPCFSIMASTSRLWVLATSLILSSKAVVSTPAALTFSVSFSQLEFKAPANIVLRASEEEFIIPPNTSDTLVQSALASSKSPTKSSHVWVHPDWAASFKVSINWVNVLTFVAAFVAVLPSLKIPSICSSVYPCPLSISRFFSISASVSPSVAIVNLLRVSVKISEVSQPSCNVSRKEPFSSIMSSIAMP